MKKIKKTCVIENTRISLKDLIPIQWDDLYIIYGPYNSDDFYRNYHLTGNKNDTKDRGISLYFISKNKVVYLENNNNHMGFRLGLSFFDEPYIEFQDNNSHPTLIKDHGVVAIYHYDTILISPSFDQLFEPCTPTPADQLH